METPIYYEQWQIYPKARIAFWTANGNAAHWSGQHIWAVNVSKAYFDKLCYWIQSQQSAAQGVG